MVKSNACLSPTRRVEASMEDSKATPMPSKGSEKVPYASDASDVLVECVDEPKSRQEVDQLLEPTNVDLLKPATHAILETSKSDQERDFERLNGLVSNGVVGSSGALPLAEKPSDQPISSTHRSLPLASTEGAEATDSTTGVKTAVMQEMQSDFQNSSDEVKVEAIPEQMEMVPRSCSEKPDDGQVTAITNVQTHCSGKELNCEIRSTSANGGHSFASESQAMIETALNVESCARHDIDGASPQNKEQEPVALVSKVNGGILRNGEQTIAHQSAGPASDMTSAHGALTSQEMRGLNGKIKDVNTTPGDNQNVMSSSMSRDEASQAFEGKASKVEAEDNNNDQTDNICKAGVGPSAGLEEQPPFHGKHAYANAADVVKLETEKQLQENKRKLGVAVSLPSKKSAKRGTKGKRNQAGAKETMVKLLGIAPAESEEWEGPVRLSLAYIASRMTLDKDRMEVTSSKGYRTVLATHGVSSGTWYFEATPTHLGNEGHVRIGWATRRMEIQGPIGFDKYGYSYRDIDGSKVHNAYRHPYGMGYREGDVLGFLIHIPEGVNMQPRDKELVMWKGRTFAVDKNLPETEPMSGSLIAFYRNGIFQGIAFSDIFSGVYYPGASIYTMPSQEEGATVRFNFGPEFVHAPPPLDGIPAAHPMCRLRQTLIIPPKVEPSSTQADVVLEEKNSKAVASDVVKEELLQDKEA